MPKFCESSDLILDAGDITTKYKGGKPVNCNIESISPADHTG